jgi:hypothetical protein
MDVIQIFLVDGTKPEQLGMLPYMLSANDPRSAREQFGAGYLHGGGWRPFEGFKLLDGGRIKYPGDPTLKPIAMMQLRNETIFFYDGAWVAIVQPDGSFEIARMD